MKHTEVCELTDLVQRVCIDRQIIISHHVYVVIIKL